MHNERSAQPNSSTGAYGPWARAAVARAAVAAAAAAGGAAAQRVPVMVCVGPPSAKRHCTDQDPADQFSVCTHTRMV